MADPTPPTTPRPKPGRGHPRAEWGISEAQAWVQGMLDAAAIAQAHGDHAMVESIAQAIEQGPF